MSPVEGEAFVALCRVETGGWARRRNPSDLPLVGWSVGVRTFASDRCSKCNQPNGFKEFAARKVNALGSRLSLGYLPTIQRSDEHAFSFSPNRCSITQDDNVLCEDSYVNARKRGPNLAANNVVYRVL